MILGVVQINLTDDTRNGSSVIILCEIQFMFIKFQIMKILFLQIRIYSEILSFQWLFLESTTNKVKLLYKLKIKRNS